MNVDIPYLGFKQRAFMGAVGPRYQSISSLNLNDDWQGKLKYSEKICPNATSSTTNHM
jgi:hypothetical protein